VELRIIVALAECNRGLMNCNIDFLLLLLFFPNKSNRDYSELKKDQLISTYDAMTAGEYLYWLKIHSSLPAQNLDASFENGAVK
jgi:hypothetical protein